MEEEEADAAGCCGALETVAVLAAACITGVEVLVEGVGSSGALGTEDNPEPRETERSGKGEVDEDSGICMDEDRGNRAVSRDPGISTDGDC